MVEYTKGLGGGQMMWITYQSTRIIS